MVGAMRGRETKEAVEIDSWNSKSRLKGKRELHVLRRNARVDRGRHPHLLLLILPEGE